MTITTTSFGYSQITQILTYILVSIGYLGIFKKCGVRRIWAFVPGVRQYKIGLCGNKEDDGRHYAIIYFIIDNKIK